MAERPRAEKSFELRDLIQRLRKLSFQSGISFVQCGLGRLSLSEATQADRPAIKDVGARVIGEDLLSLVQSFPARLQPAQAELQMADGGIAPTLHATLKLRCFRFQTRDP